MTSQTSSELTHVAHTAQRLSPLIVNFLRERLNARGERQSGLYDYYRAFLDKEMAFARYDVPIAEFIARNANEYARYIEIGAGVGQLPVLLAAQGFRTVAVDGDSARFEAARDLFAEIAGHVEGIGPSLHAVHGFFPSPAVDMIDGHSLVIFTGVIHDLCDEEAMLKACGGAGGIIMDLTRFTKMRSSPASWSQLAERVCALGFASPAPVYVSGSPDESDAQWKQFWRVVYFRRHPRSPLFRWSAVGNRSSPARFPLRPRGGGFLAGLPDCRSLHRLSSAGVGAGHDPFRTESF